MDKKRVPPRIEWVRKYVVDNGYFIDPDEFYDYHESRGWRVGKLAMKDWQAAVRTWVRQQLRYSDEAHKRSFKQGAKSNHARICSALQRQITSE